MRPVALAISVALAACSSSEGGGSPNPAGGGGGSGTHAGGSWPGGGSGGTSSGGTNTGGTNTGGTNTGGTSSGGTSSGGTSSGGTGTGGVGGCDVLPSGFPSSFALWSRNPVLIPSKGAAAHGADNVYAPDLHSVSGVYVMFYGAQGGDGHDRIYLAWSKDRGEWRKYPSDAAPSPVLDRGASNHVNDPSAVFVGGKWRMYYTDAAVDIDDRIWLAESSKLTGFSKIQLVLDKGAPGSWEAEKVGRPSVLYEGGVYEMWYDGQANGARHVGYATSTDGVTFTRHPQNPVFKNAGAVDVKKIGGVYVMAREAGDGTYWATSPDGVCWVDRGKLFGKSGSGYDAFGQVTPFLDTAGDKLEGVWFGAASVATWDKNRIAVAWANGFSPPSGGGCTECTTAGVSCGEACHAAALSGGVCGSPGSTNPGVCCACSSEGCDGCKGSAKDCQEACVSAGKAGGFCGNPGSTNPSACCSCLD
ncbi:MAG: hypothetical protein U0263_02460 [Polyangiaceae bacterium]